MSLVERAKALLLLKDALGDFYEEQKQAIIEETLTLPLPRCAPVLSSFVQCKFITSQELSQLLSKSSSTVAAPPQPAVVVPATPSTPKLGADSDRDAIIQFLGQECTVAKEELEKYNQVINQLRSTMAVESLQELLNLEESHLSFGILDDIISSAEKDIFFQLLETLTHHDDFTRNARQQKNEEAQSQLQVQQQQQLVESQDRTRAMFQFHGAEAQAIVLPIGSDFYYYASVELEQEKPLEPVDPALAEERSQYIFFCLDISASMNHNERGEYCAPKSPDHPHSSIKKARELIPSLVLRAIQRHAIVYIIVWNYKVQKVIEFTPSMFLQEDINEFISDERILASVREQTSDRAFVAKGGTNVEAALTQVMQLVSEHLAKISSAEVWFLTDGEETVYVKAGGELDRIPSNPNASNFAYFNYTNEHGVTSYQQKLMETLKTRLEPLDERNIPLDFHSCQFSDADPIFLRALCEWVGGSFHTFADVSNLEKEMAADNKSSSQFFIAVEGNGSQPAHSAPAAINNGILCARGKLPANLFLHSILPGRRMVIRRGRNQYVLDSFATNPFGDSLRDGVTDIIHLEPSLDRFMEKLNGDVRSRTIHEACKELNKFRSTRMNALGRIARLVRAGTQLQMFLETILESVESQIDSLERLLSQYQLDEGKKFDASSASENDLLSERQKAAIAVGLDSMRVRLGNGIVSQTSLDKRLRQLIARNGTRARQLLSRQCLLIESTHGERVWLSLFIVEGNQWLEAQTQFVDQQCELYFPDVNSIHLDIKYSHELLHGDEPEDCLLDWKLTISNVEQRTSKSLDGRIPLKEYIPSIVTEYHCQPLESCLEEHRKRFIDPLSYCSFTDLIRENNTLPAFLYQIRASQSVGLVFNAKELLFVEDGGKDATSFDYFRLYWRLAPKTVNQCVTVPGTFSSANAALPMAPEPLTHAVLAKLMPGLLSEFVTGTPMAPMPCSVLFYCGYLMMHLYRPSFAGVDVSRSVEILSTIGVWLDNPQTSPPRQELDDIVRQVAVERQVAPKDSPGKTLPVKAFVYCIIDDSFSLAEKFSGLQSIVTKRWYKFLSTKSDHPPDMKSICLAFIETAAGPIQYEEEVPVSLLDAAEEIAHAVTTESNNAELLSHSPSLCQAALTAITTVFHGPELEAWARVQMVLYRGSVMATMSVRQLQERFKNFEDTNDLEDEIFAGVRCATIPWSCALISSWSEENATYCVLTWEAENLVTLWQIKEKQLTSTTHRIDELHLLPLHVLQDLWDHTLCLLRLWYWKGRKSNCYGLHDVDYEVIAALKDTTKTEQLSQMQLSEYHAALAHKKPAYEAWVPKKEEVKKIAEEDNVVIDQSQMYQGNLPRISLIVIGAVDSGKSTTSGRFVYDRGLITRHQLDQLAKMAEDYGRPTFKYAWIMDRFKHERQAGVTVEVSFWSLETRKYQLDLIDAPGHQSFLKNMACGASLSDAALLIVSAAPNEFERGICRDGMTRQETMLAYASGVRQFIVAINKMDTVDYSEERYQEVKSNVLSLLKRVGLDPKRQIVLPISGYEGDNMMSPSKKMPWFTGWEYYESPESAPVHGKTLVDAIDYGLTVPRRSVSQPIRIPVHKLHRVEGVGTVLTGRLLTGELKAGQEVMVSPIGKKGVVRTMESFHRPKSTAYAGDIVGINVPLSGADLRKISARGFVIGPVSDPAPVVRSFKARVIITNHDNIREGFSPFIYCHTASFTVRFFKLLERIVKITGEKEENPTTLRKGDVAIVQVVTQHAVSVEPFSKCPPLGRFVMQVSNTLVGMGQILEVSAEDPTPVRRPASNQNSSLFSAWGEPKRSRVFRC